MNKEKDQVEGGGTDTTQNKKPKAEPKGAGTKGGVKGRKGKEIRDGRRKKYLALGSKGLAA